jgi:protein-S-isoprenylcysteine O-methyltransferase Ste14
MDTTDPRAGTRDWHAPDNARGLTLASAQRPRLLDVVAGVAMAAIWSMFAYRHLKAFSTTGEWLYLIICLSETLTAGFFLIRTAPVSVSTRPLDWLFALGGTFTPLFFSPSTGGVLPDAKFLSYVGICLQIVSLLSLNRSFALVAAMRKIKTGGMYRLVRHPLYASYWLIFTSYLLTNSSWANFSVYLVTMGFLGVRAVREEAHLSADPAYRDYMARVPHRIVPFVF